MKSSYWERAGREAVKSIRSKQGVQGFLDEGARVVEVGRRLAKLGQRHRAECRSIEDHAVFADAEQWVQILRSRPEGGLASQWHHDPRCEMVDGFHRQCA